MNGSLEGKAEGLRTAQSRTRWRRTPDPLQTLKPAGRDVRLVGRSGPLSGGHDIRILCLPV